MFMQQHHHLLGAVESCEAKGKNKGWQEPVQPALLGLQISHILVKATS